MRRAPRGSRNNTMSTRRRGKRVEELCVRFGNIYLYANVMATNESVREEGCVLYQKLAGLSLRAALQPPEWQRLARGPSK